MRDLKKNLLSGEEDTAVLAKWFELQTLLTNPKSDYSNLLKTKDNKVMDNATKLLLYCSCFFQLLCMYNPPKPKPEPGQKYDYEYGSKYSKYEHLKHTFRVNMLNCVRYLHETHLILCKYIYTKVQSKSVSDLNNIWVKRLGMIIHWNFEVNIGDKNHPG